MSRKVATGKWLVQYLLFCCVLGEMYCRIMANTLVLTVGNRWKGTISLKWSLLPKEQFLCGFLVNENFVNTKQENGLRPAKDIMLQKQMFMGNGFLHAGRPRLAQVRCAQQGN